MLPDNTPNHFIFFNESSTSFSSWSECENLMYWHHLDPESIHPHQTDAALCPDIDSASSRIGGKNVTRSPETKESATLVDASLKHIH